MTPELRALALRILTETRDLVLATNRPDGWPQATMVSYVADGFDVYFVIGRDSQKFKNLSADPKVSIVVGGSVEDWMKIQGLSFAGLATLMTDEAGIKHTYALLAKKFPVMADMGMPDLKQIAAVKVSPKVMSILDYTKGFAHTDLVTF